MKKFYKQYLRGQRVKAKNKNKSWFSLQVNNQLPQNPALLRSFWEGFSGRPFGST